MANINSFSLSNIHSVIASKLKTCCSPNSVTIQNTIVTGSDGNIMQYHTFEILFLRVTKENFSARNSVLKTYDKTAIPQLATFSVTTKHKKHKL